MSKKLLSLETSTNACSVALLWGDNLIERYEIAPRRHGQLILPMVRALLAEAGLTLRELDALAFGCGPGAFTGLRIATAVVQGLAFSADLPVVPVSTLRAMAQRAAVEHGATQVLTGLDARMQEVYWGAYRQDDNHLMVNYLPDQLCQPQDISVPEAGQWLGVGDAWETYGDLLKTQCGTMLQAVVVNFYPRAREVAELGWVDFQAGCGVSADQALPVYLRGKGAWRKQD